MHSLKIKLTLIMASMITAVIVIVCVLNLTLFENYYEKNRLNELENSYLEISEKIGELSNDPEDEENIEINEEIISLMKDLESLHNIETFVIDGNFTTVYTSQSSKFNDYIKRLRNILFDSDIQEIGDFHTLKETDDTTGITYLEIYGFTDNNYTIFMQITVDSMQENISIFNRFVQIAGGIILVITILIAYFVAKKFTKPMKELASIAEQMSELNFQVKYRRKDKSELSLLGKSMNIMSENLQLKISELKIANLELLRDIEIKTKNEQMRSEFLSNVSHELKTPIALIQGYSEGLKEGINDDPENMEFYCDVIIDEAIKMNEMVKKLLTLNQIEFGEDQLDAQRFNLTEMISSVLRSNTIRLEQKEIHLECNLLEDVYVLFDQIQMEEVITNYLSNAINHCDYEKQIRVTMKKNNGKIMVSIYNTGENIPQEDIDRIWEKFYKVDKARTRQYGGNGIGLSIVKAIMDNYNGSYGVENIEQGVSFWFEIDID